jgi:hypothetical protein
MFRRGCICIAGLREISRSSSIVPKGVSPVKFHRHTLILSVVAAFAFLVVVPTPLAAQARPNPPTRAPSRGPATGTTRDMYERDMNIRRLELERDSNKKPTFEVSKETVKQVSEDFEQIQGINAEIIGDYVSGKGPDYKHISEAMAEITKRATRLNTNLLLPSDDTVVSGPVTQSEVHNKPARSPLLDLNDLIFSFVTNPIFKNANTIDLTLGAKAKRDLASIIDLSDRISKSADKLSKTSAKRN